MKRYVAGFLFNEDGTKVVLIEKKRPIWMAGKLNAIGGKIEYDERPINAQRREFFEETGVKTNDWELFCYLSGRNINKEKFIVYFYRKFSFMIDQVDTTTDEKVSIFSVNELWNSSNQMSNLKWLLALALDQQLIVPINIEEKSLV